MNTARDRQNSLPRRPWRAVEVLQKGCLMDKMTFYIVLEQGGLPNCQKI